jgi:glycosyltransferase involved in cell wall biosynthesis
MAELKGGITVLMPLYNCSKYVEASVRSILEQSFREFEFLIIDDGSTDNSAELVSTFNDSRIILHKKHHTGLADTLNTGLKMAHGKWIARIDADDIAVTDRLKLQTEFLKNNPDVDVIAGSSVYFSGNGKVEFTVRPPTDDKSIKEMLNVHNPVNHSAVTFKKEDIIAEGGYDVSMTCFEDFELWLRLRDKLRFQILPEYLAFTRIRNDSMTAAATYNKIYEVLIDNFTRLKKSSQDEEYLNAVKFRIEYFYGNKDEARKTRPPLNSASRIAAFASTLLPEESFRKLKNSRLRFRLSLGKQEKAKLEEELAQYLK